MQTDLSTSLPVREITLSYAHKSRIIFKVEHPKLSTGLIDNGSRPAEQDFKGYFRGTFVLTRILICSVFSPARRASLPRRVPPLLGRRLLVGAGYTSAESDYADASRASTSTVISTFSRHFGVEGELPQRQDASNSILYEKTYEVGPRYFRTYGPFVPYVKIMIGHGVFNYPPIYARGTGSGARQPRPTTDAGGFGIDYQGAARTSTSAADFEYQKWSGFRRTRSLSPSSSTFGAAYHFR